VFFSRCTNTAVADACCNLKILAGGSPALVLISFGAHGAILPHFSRDSRRFSYVEWEKPGEVRDEVRTRLGNGWEELK